MFTRIGAAAYKKDLTNTIALCDLLGNPENGFKSIHIAGTNGKGSTSHMIASILQEAGYKTGLYTSPHLKDFRERIRINGEVIGEDEVIAFVKQYKSDFERIEPSFFEWTVALCFTHFVKYKVDVAVVETGLGGRLDSTNVISPLLSVITNIGWDHTDILGDSLEKIAYEKAGIIKKNTPVIIGETQPETTAVFNKKASEENAPIAFADQVTEMSEYKLLQDGISCTVKNETSTLNELVCELGGIYQIQNIKTVFTAITSLQQSGFKISEQHIRHGLAKVKSNTGLAGRWQVLGQSPLIICDTGHNVDGINYVVKQLSMQNYKKLHMVVGMVKDKDISKVLALLPKEAAYYFCNANIPRALPAEELKEKALAFGLNGEAYGKVGNAFLQAKKMANVDDLIFVGGSTFVVAEVI